MRLRLTLFIIGSLYFSLSIPSLADIDNYLFKDITTCQECLKELSTRGMVKTDELYSCKARYGSKTDSAYYLEYKSGNFDRFFSEIDSGSSVNRHHSSIEHQKLTLKQKGLDALAVQRLCPQSYQTSKESSK